MPYQCRMVPDDPGKERKPGDMWYVPLMLRDAPNVYTRRLLSTGYMRISETRAPLVVVLPDGTPHCLDHAYSNTRDSTREGWTVTGDAPNVTVSPSINYEGHYHGWLINGVLSDDTEGRGY